LNLSRCARGRPVRRRTDDRDSRHRHLFFSKRRELHCCHRRINNDEIAAAKPASYSRVSAGTCMERDRLFSKTSARAHDSPALFCGGVFGWSYTVLMPALARDVLGRGANGYGILISASGAGALIVALIVAAYGHLVTPRN